jgi:hypothetical protein
MQIGVTAVDFLQTVSISLGITVSLTILAGLATKYIPMPYWEKRQSDRDATLLSMVTEARDAANLALTEVTRNGHAGKVNTLKDDVADLKESVARVIAALDRLAERSEVRHDINSTKLDRHMEQAAMEFHRVWSRVMEMEARRDR